MGLVLCSMWDLPGPGTELVSPALADGFLPTGPPEKSHGDIYIYIYIYIYIHFFFS